MAMVCVLCGTDYENTSIIVGINGFVCHPCLGEAFAAMARAQPRRVYAGEVATMLNANRCCLICAELITKYSLVAYRGPYCFCGRCLRTAFDICLDTEEGRLAIVEF